MTAPATETPTATGAPAAPRGRIEVWLGLAGSLLVCLGSFGIADIPRNDATLSNLGMQALNYGHGRGLANVSFWAGLALLVLAWIRLGRMLADGSCGLTLRSVRIAVLTWTVPMLFAAPVYSRDVYAYLAQGALYREGFSPYENGPAHYPGPLLDSMAQVWASASAPYGSLFMALARGVTEITGDNVVAGIAGVRIALLPGLLLALWGAPKLAAHFGAGRRMALWLLLLNPMILIHLVGGPHVELLMIGFLVAGVALVATGRHWWGLVVLGLSVTTKVTAIIAVPFVAWMWLSHIRQRRTVTARDYVGVFAATAAIPTAVFVGVSALLGQGLGIGWISGVGWSSRNINWLALPTLFGHGAAWVASPFATWHLQDVLSVTRAIGYVVLAVILVALWFACRHTDRTAMAGMIWGMLAMLLLEPATLPWYYSWALCLAVAFTLPAWGRALVVGFSVFLLMVVQPDDSILFYKPLDLLFITALSVLAGAAMMRPDPLRIGAAARRWWGT